MTGSDAHCATLVRAGDRDRWLSALFAPQDRRPALLALAAFDLELSRVREAVSSPLAGEVRLRWWADAIAGDARGAVRASPVADALLDAIERHRLPRAALVGMTEARIVDLYDDPFPTLNDLEGYCGETACALIRLGALALSDGAEPGDAEAAGLAGVARALAGIALAFPLHARQGRVYLPADLMARHGVSREAIVLGRAEPGLAAALAELRAHAARRHDEARRAVSRLDPALLPAYLPLATTPLLLRAAERAGPDPFAMPKPPSDWRRQWAIWLMARA